MVRPSTVSIGQRFGRLTVIEEVAARAFASGQSQRQFKVRCDCPDATEKIVLGLHLSDGTTQSCGCLHRELMREAETIHSETEGSGRRKSTEYAAWSSMKQRCENENATGYKNYGGRGIKVCERWRNSYSDFLADILATIGRRPSPQHSIDRFPDPDGDYCPGNVRWATKSQQRQNQRPRKAKNNPCS